MKIAFVLSLFAMVAARSEGRGRLRSAGCDWRPPRAGYVIELYPDKAPKTVENFLAHVESGFYDGTIFHRVIPAFMNQGGGFTPDLKLKATRGTILNEADNGLRNETGTVAMARKPDPHSATAQFFINTADNAFLNHTAKDPRGWGYAVFGKVVEGMDVVQAISAVPTTRKNGMSDVPVEAVMILSARRHEPAAAD